MKTKRTQRGMTLTGLIIGMAIVGFFGFFAMQLFPMYSEYRAVVEAMNAVKGEPNVRNANPGQVWTMLEKRFVISYIESVKKEHVTLDKRTGTLNIKYEVRRPFMYNLDLVAKFDYSVELGT